MSITPRNFQVNYNNYFSNLLTGITIRPTVKAKPNSMCYSLPALVHVVVV